MKEITVRVGGKVLLVGGYSILYEQGLGISISVDQCYDCTAMVTG